TLSSRGCLSPSARRLSPRFRTSRASRDPRYAPNLASASLSGGKYTQLIALSSSHSKILLTDSPPHIVLLNLPRWSSRFSIVKLRRAFPVSVMSSQGRYAACPLLSRSPKTHLSLMLPTPCDFAGSSMD